MSIVCFFLCVLVGLGAAPVASAQSLSAFVVDEGADAILRYDDNFSGPDELVSSADVGNPARVALDPVNGWVYWSDVGASGADGRILRARRGGAAVETVISGYDNPAGLAIDTENSALYWSDSQTNTIYQSGLDGSNPQVLFSTSTDVPNEIQLDLQNDMIYWVNGGTVSGSDGSIVRANLDGSGVPVEIVSDLENPIGLALDVNGNQVYWAERGGRTISRAELDGSNIEGLIDDATAPIDVAPLGLTIDLDNSKLYWTSAATNGGNSVPGQISRADLDGSNTESVVTSGLDRPIGIALNTSSSALPVELTSFEGRIDKSGVILQWRTASEQQNAGFSVQHYREGAFTDIGWVEGAGTTVVPQRYTHRINGLQAGMHRFRLKQVDLDGTTALSAEVEVTVDSPQKVTLSAPYPNPTQGMTRVDYDVPRDGLVEISVHDVLGRRVQTVVARVQPAGQFTATIETAQLPSGVYFVRLAAGGTVQHAKVSVTR